jgi:hypothetical protein
MSAEFLEIAQKAVAEAKAKHVSDGYVFVGNKIYKNIDGKLVTI